MAAIADAADATQQGACRLRHHLCRSRGAVAHDATCPLAAWGLRAIEPVSNTVRSPRPRSPQAAQHPSTPPAAPPVTALCFEQALARVRPSLARGFEAPVAHTTWDNIGGADEAKRRLRQTVEWPLLHPDAFARMSLAPPRGVLLYGPPGCSKTTLARAAATATGVAFVPLSCAQLYSKVTRLAVKLTLVVSFVIISNCNIQALLLSTIAVLGGGRVPSARCLSPSAAGSPQHRLPG